jgi:protein-disulfide isomerase
LITRRRFVTGTVALGGALLASTALSGIVVQSALAQTPSPAELAEAGPLGEQALGAENAPVTIIEYASMTCGACADFHNKTYPTLKSKYIDTGKVRYILREFPIDPTAAGAFMLARCAGKDKYFPLVEAFFAQQSTWATAKQPIPPMLAIAKQAGFTEASFKECLENQQVLDGIEWVLQRGQKKFGVNSTPTFFINGKLVRGTMSMQELEKHIEPYLKGG